MLPEHTRRFPAAKARRFKVVFNLTDYDRGWVYRPRGVRPSNVAIYSLNTTEVVGVVSNH